LTFGGFRENISVRCVLSPELVDELHDLPDSETGIGRRPQAIFERAVAGEHSGKHIIEPAC